MRTDKYQIRNHPQIKRLGNLFDDLCDVHNHFLALEKRYYRMFGKYAGRYGLQPHLTKLLQRTHKHWAWIPRDTLDQTTGGVPSENSHGCISKSPTNTEIGIGNLPLTFAEGLTVSPPRHSTLRET